MQQNLWRITDSRTARSEFFFGSLFEQIRNVVNASEVIKVAEKLYPYGPPWAYVNDFCLGDAVKTSYQMIATYVITELETRRKNAKAATPATYSAFAASNPSVEITPHIKVEMIDPVPDWVEEYVQYRIVQLGVPSPPAQTETTFLLPNFVVEIDVAALPRSLRDIAEKNPTNSAKAFLYGGHKILIVARTGFGGYNLYMEGDPDVYSVSAATIEEIGRDFLDKMVKVGIYYCTGPDIYYG